MNQNRQFINKTTFNHQNNNFPKESFRTHNTKRYQSITRSDGGNFPPVLTRRVIDNIRKPRENVSSRRVEMTQPMGVRNNLPISLENIRNNYHKMDRESLFNLHSNQLNSNHRNRTENEIFARERLPINVNNNMGNNIGGNNHGHPLGIEATRYDSGGSLATNVIPGPIITDEKMKAKVKKNIKNMILRKKYNRIIIGGLGTAFFVAFTS